MLQQLQTLLATHKQCSAAQLARQLNCDLSAIEAMLSLLQQRQRVKQQQITGCGGACGCATTANTVYSLATEVNKVANIPLLQVND